MILQRAWICFPLCSHLSSTQSADSSPALHSSLLLSLCYPRGMLMVYYLAAARVQHVMPLPAPWGIVYQRFCCGYIAETLVFFTCTQQFCFSPLFRKTKHCDGAVSVAVLHADMCIFRLWQHNVACFLFLSCCVPSLQRLPSFCILMFFKPFLFAAMRDLCMHPHTTQRCGCRALTGLERLQLMETLECLAGLWKKKCVQWWREPCVPRMTQCHPSAAGDAGGKSAVCRERTCCLHVQSLILKADEHEHIPHGSNRNCDVWRNVEIQEIQPECAVYMTCITLGILPYSE